MKVTSMSLRVVSPIVFSICAPFSALLLAVSGEGPFLHCVKKVRESHWASEGKKNQKAK